MDYTIDDVENLLENIISNIPNSLLKGLNGGIILMEEEKIHEEAEDNDLFILGEYIRFGVRRQINIYYGSIKHNHPYLEKSDLYKKLEDLVNHELRHHIEYKANVKDLIIEDDEYLLNYKKRKNLT